MYENSKIQGRVAGYPIQFPAFHEIKQAAGRLSKDNRPPAGGAFIG
jgi:hypothetical protein